MNAIRVRLVVGVTLLFSGPLLRAADRPPNILIIFTDDKN
jgi:hypothetical protein